MAIDLYRLARMLEEAAILLEIKGENKFKTKAYNDGADIIRRRTDFVANATTAEKLQEIDGIGKALSEKIIEYKQTGSLAFYRKVLGEVPESLLSLAQLKGLGPKKTAQVWKELGVIDLNGLELSIKNGNLTSLKGFGAKTISSINKNLQFVKKKSDHVLLSTAIEEADIHAKSLLAIEGVTKVGITGQISLAWETVDEIRLVVAVKENEAIRNIEVAVNGIYDPNNSIIVAAKKRPKLSIIITKDEDFHWTVHEESMEGEFKEAYLSYLGDTGWKFEKNLPYKGDKKITFQDTEDIYNKVGLQFIPREIRSEGQTVHFAANGYLPELVKNEDLRGLVHMHTTWSDGKNTTREMAEAAMARGMTYMLVTDHSQTAAYAGGLTPERIRHQHQEIDKLNDEFRGRFTILKGIESDILPDGSLDYPDNILASFDAVIGSIHGQFDLHPEQQTDRLVRALENPYLHILGHSTGRLLLRRPGYEFDMLKIIDTAAEYGKIIEINSNPYRLDLPSEYIKEAKTKGIRFSINPDAHNTLGIFHVDYGVKMARKGWLSASDIINTLDSRGFINALAKS